MKAIVHRAYGKPTDVLKLEEVEKPVPADGQVLVRVRASSVNSANCRVVRPSPFFIRLMIGIRAPSETAFGSDVAGVVEALGKDTDLQIGDEVFGTAGGAFAEYVVGTKFVRKPMSMTLEQAAAVPVAAITALQAVRDKAGVKPGDRVLVNGAGGGVGSFAVQIAKAMGADVTAVTAADKVQVVKDLGADHVLVRDRDDYTRSTEKYDAIIDCGGDRSFSASLRVLAPQASLVIVGAHKRLFRRLIGATLRNRLLKQRIVFFMARVTREDLQLLAELIDAGKVSPAIDRAYSLERAAEAVAYAETQQASGKVVITVA